jgi:hypothetical protein
MNTTRQSIAILMEIKQAIRSLSPEDQAKVERLAERIKAIVADDEICGGLALALVGALAALDE